MQLSNALDGSSASALRPSQPSAFSDLGTDEFVRIIFAELANQDPLAPSDSKALLEQLSSLRSIQSNTDMTNRLASLVGQNELAAAAGLIGKRISGISEDFQRQDGIVTSVSRTKAGAILNLSGGYRIPMSSVDEVLNDTGSATGGGAS